jgi:hypothetical protein
MIEYLAMCEDGHRSYVRLHGAPTAGICMVMLKANLVELFAAGDTEIPERLHCGKLAELYPLDPVLQRRKR